ncbi:MAG: hypothetical protein NZM38_06135 [Cytophagales bacterium]|nr:hypothetical protein [Cytophagales bacterium]MDW8384335.1 hypothetical protein [Flammeovirgaceae bacterium]
MAKADKFFENKDYRNALPLYQKLEITRLEDALLHYKIGICYFHAEYARRKAIPHFQFCIKHKNTAPIPPEVHYYLARTYHLQDMFVEAIQEYEEYVHLTKNTDKPLFTDALLQIERCKVAIEQMKPSFPKSATTEVMNFPINTSYDDYAPQVTSKAHMMVFASNRLANATNLIYGDEYPFLPDNLVNKQTDVFVSFRKGVVWQFPFPQGLNKHKSSISTVSLNSDGTQLLLCIGNSIEKGALYISRFKAGKWTEPKPLKMGDNYYVFGASFAYGGSKIIYSSNKPGGYGGYDIYIADIDEKGNLTNHQNMGGKINSEYDEVTPFWMPSNKLFFSSNGLNSVGGFDIFSSEFGKGEWNSPVSLGIPINSGSDELFYTSYSNGKYAYFSTNRESDTQSKGGWDIMSAFRPESPTPFAMVRGVIKATKNGKMIPVKLSVYDVPDNIPQKYIYNPDTNGKYFMILPHNKSYKIKIEYGVNLYHTVQIEIPKETHNYEINQEILVNDITLLGNVVGENSRVEKSEFKISKRMQSDTFQTDIRYDALVLLMERIVDAADMEGLTQIDHLEKLAQQTIMREKQKEYSPDDFYTPLIDLVEEAIAKGDAKQLLELDKPRTADAKSVSLHYKTSSKGKHLILSYPLSFKRNYSGLENGQQQEIAAIAAFLQQNTKIKVELCWFFDAVSPEDQILSKIEFIKDIFKEKQIPESRIHIVKNDINAYPNSPYINVELRLFEHE